jgi:hypothetical protein
MNRWRNFLERIFPYLKYKREREEQVLQFLRKHEAIFKDAMDLPFIPPCDERESPPEYRKKYNENLWFHRLHNELWYIGSNIAMEFSSYFDYVKERHHRK